MTDVYVVERCYDFDGCKAVTARGSLEAATADAHKTDFGDEIRITRFDTETGLGVIVSNLKPRWGEDGMFWEEVYREEPTNGEHEA